LDVAIPRAASRPHDSTSVWSRSSSKAAITSAPRASRRRDRMSPPCGFGAARRVPANDRRHPDAETLRRLAMPMTLIDERHDERAKLYRMGLAHV